jgi:dTDP-glucose pyrophosphorylase
MVLGDNIFYGNGFGKILRKLRQKLKADGRLFLDTMSRTQNGLVL